MAQTITSYRDLVVWQKAMALADLVYSITDTLPAHERFGLVFQMRKAAVSVPSNIAEGSRHRTPGYISRVIIALGEHAELETQALLSERRHYISIADMSRFNGSSRQVGELAHGLLRSLEALQLSRQVVENEVPRIPNRTKPTAQDTTNPKSQVPNPDSI